jgi:hypothetical protein
LDCADTRLKLLNKPFMLLPLLYCMRCALCWHDFQYEVIDDQTIRVIESFLGELMTEDWRENVNLDSFPVRVISLEPIPARVEELYDRLNANLKITDSEEVEICSVTGQYANPEVGAYPIVDAINQVGGRAFLCQRLDDPDCPKCDKPMSFIASLTNDKRQSFVVSHDGVQIVFFLCAKCHVVHVQHSAD